MQPPFFAQRPAAVQALHLAPPPRNVATGATLAAALSIGPLFAWTLVGFMSIFFWTFAMDSEWLTMIELRGTLEHTQGTVTGVSETNAKENKSRIYAVDYTYSVGGKSHRGRSFTLTPPNERASVEVEHLRAAPAVSRITGMRRRTFGAAAALAALPAPIVFIIAVWLTIGGARRARLLKHGRLGFARLVDKRATNTRINKRRVHEYIFELEPPPDEVPAAYRAAWQSAAPRHRFTFKTHDGAAIEDQPLEPAVYDPARPGSGLPLDALPIVTTPSGDIDARGWQLWRPLLPALVVAGNLAALVLLLS